MEAIDREIGTDAQEDNAKQIIKKKKVRNGTK